jgi:hypothetical protein
MLELQEARSGIRPQEFALLAAIYKTAVMAPWFSRDEQQRKQFARYVITTFREGMTDPYELKAHCMDVAKQRFSQPNAH